MGQFRHHHSGKTRTMALFWLRTSYHAQRYMFQRYILRSFAHAKFQHCEHSNYFVILQKVGPRFCCRGQ